MVAKSLLLSQTYLEEIQFQLSNDQTAEFLEKSGFAGKIIRRIPCIFDVTFENVNPNSRLDAGFVFIDNQSKKEVCVDIVTFFTLPKEGEYELRVYQLGRRRELHEDSG
jgi:hypothetical protein